MCQGVYVGHHERSVAALFLTPTGLSRGTGMHKLRVERWWDGAYLSCCDGLPWEPRPKEQRLIGPGTLEGATYSAPLPDV
eukprot:12889794-Prorocentrum_lima.AAC.1